MNQSNEIDKLAGALKKFQAAIEPLKRNKTAKIGAKFSYSYTSLDALIEHVTPELHKNDLVISQGGDGSNVTTTLMHESGQWKEAAYPIPQGITDPQDLGKVITYLRRYGEAAILNIAPDDDTDGALKKKQTNKAEAAPDASDTDKDYHHNPDYVFKKGEYKDKRISDLPDDYLEWAASNTDGWMYRMAVAEKARRSLMDAPFE